MQDLYKQVNFSIDFYKRCVTISAIHGSEVGPSGLIYRAKYTYGGKIMAFVITDECLSCGSCAAQCPAEAIDMGDLHYEIDADKCLECGACAAQCPAEAIVQE